MVKKDEETLEITVGFDRKYTPNDLIDLEEAKKFIESTTIFEPIDPYLNYHIDFSNEPEKEELLVHSDGMIYLKKVTNDAKTEIPELIKKGYNLIKRLNDIDLVYKKELKLFFKGDDTLKVYDEIKPEIDGSIGEIFGGNLTTTYQEYGDFFRVDYSPSDTF